MTRLYLTNYIGDLGYQDNEVYEYNNEMIEEERYTSYEKYISEGIYTSAGYTPEEEYTSYENNINFIKKKNFLKEKLNIDISNKYEYDYYFRIDKKTCKIFYPYSRIIFEFDENSYMKDNSNVKCIIEYNQYVLFDIKDLGNINYNSCEFIKTLDIIQEDVNINSKKFVNKFYSNYQTTECKSLLANFDFKFTTNDSDIDIFLPYVEILVEFLTMWEINTTGRKPLIEKDFFVNSVQKIVDKNLIKKKKSNKRLINLDDVLDDLKELKKTIIPIIYEYLIKKNTLSESLKKWFLGLSRTLTNVIVEHYFSKIIINYTPHQEIKNKLVYKKKTN